MTLLKKTLEPFFVMIVFAALLKSLLFGITQIPGLHFDEAWQGLFALRILNEPSFWPFEAMNSYTSPVVHYFLSIVFKYFGASLLSMRAFYAALNFASGIFIFTYLWKKYSLRSGIFFIAFFSLLPIFVHDHRFYVEVTGWHSFCFSLILFLSLYYKNFPETVGIWISFIYVLGLFSHVSFMVFLLAATMISLLHTKDMNVFRLLSINCFFTFFAAIRMAAGLSSILPYMLAIGFFILGICLYHDHTTLKLQKLAAAFHQIFKFVGFVLIAAFIIIHMDGVWSYAQATGNIPVSWIPLNAVFFIVLLILSAKEKPIREFEFLQYSLLFTTAVVFKPSPRFFLIHAILLAAWGSILLHQYGNEKKRIPLFLFFIAVIGWNIQTFNKHYIENFRTSPPTDETFKYGFFKDSGRDFRPFQLAYTWAIKHDCQFALTWVEDDRFLRPIEFLKNNAPPIQGACPWSSDDLFLHHIPNYSKLNPTEKRTAENTPPPYPHVKLLAHSKNWGDLAYWVRITK